MSDKKASGSCILKTPDGQVVVGVCALDENGVPQMMEADSALGKPASMIQADLLAKGVLNRFAELNQEKSTDLVSAR